MRHFRHLGRDEITEIIVSYNSGVRQADLARQFNVDHSTIDYHVRKYQTAYPEQGGIYSLIKIGIKRECHHPSSKCTLCGLMSDELRRDRVELPAQTPEPAAVQEIQGCQRVGAVLVVDDQQIGRAHV